jgi:hypothetical protein
LDILFYYLEDISLSQSLSVGQEIETGDQKFFIRRLKVLQNDQEIEIGFFQEIERMIRTSKLFKALFRHSISGSNLCVYQIFQEIKSLKNAFNGVFRLLIS